MDFAYNNRSNNRLEQETYWKQYGWMSRLGLKAPRQSSSRSFSSATAPTTPPVSASPRNISRRPSMRDVLPARGCGAAEHGVARVFKTLNELAAKGLVCADMDEDGLSMSFKCDYDAIESILADTADNSADIEPTSESSEGEVDDNAYDKMS